MSDFLTGDTDTRRGLPPTGGSPRLSQEMALHLAHQYSQANGKYSSLLHEGHAEVGGKAPAIVIRSRLKALSHIMPTFYAIEEQIMSQDRPTAEGIITDSQGRHISREVANALNTARARVRPAVAAERMWNRLFTEEDRQRLGGDLEGCWTRLGTIRMWIQARGDSLERAVIEVAHGLGMMSEQTASWLQRELELESAVPVPPSDRPIFDSATGELWFGGRVVRRVRVMAIPSSIHRVLAAFQDAGWPRSIGDPLNGGQQQLHEVIRYLNSRLEEIRFHVQQGGRAVTWDRT